MQMYEKILIYGVFLFILICRCDINGRFCNINTSQNGLIVVIL